MVRKVKSYREEQGELLDELDRRARALVVAEFVAYGKWVGVDVVAEILDCDKSTDEVFEMIRQKRGVSP